MPLSDGTFRTITNLFLYAFINLAKTRRQIDADLHDVVVDALVNSKLRNIELSRSVLKKPLEVVHPTPAGNTHIPGPGASKFRESTGRVHRWWSYGSIGEFVSWRC